ncbi:tripartite tricarboxylate transporter TctB family protein [Halomonas sp. McH1-25]|uniref:tripartite tricarboxylate transporter TctB family protein n=1 Tax=unclassified Halomonas TaxID=2609666 RepID=UPI001EF68E4D|nr:MULTISPECIES: tripartite tricarboxylate transporter TctB family protein [unclassified Halomonas]MCG7599675.1 tripartite tricarboxylate transporter TctB family protein [Halomonas sp. McH1-25]MCP1344790.1 tripartite tricarboxylate transporter TctB family protein [Halomonas sp. FL8]MCP1362125.1 tripartite tricarboxylate transporter TctB family protein [Halomonas sp. BBD45]
MLASLTHPRLWLALALLAAGIGLSVVAWNGPDGAMLVPRVVLAIWCAMALSLVIVEALRRAPPLKPSLSPLPLLMGAVLVAAVTVDTLGFLLPALVLVALTLWLFRVRRPLPLLVGTVLIGGGLWFLFHHVLLIRLPAMMNSGVI